MQFIIPIWVSKEWKVQLKLLLQIFDLEATFAHFNHNFYI